MVSLPAVNAGYVGVTGLEITDDYVHVESAYPTSSVDGGYYRHYQCPYFLNYCSGCGCYGTISFEQCNPSNGVVPGFTSIEGMYFCTNCDRDYSCISGIDHGYEGIYLYRYTPPQPEPEPVESVKKPTVADKIKSHMDKGWPELLSLGMGVNKSNHFGGDIV